jgi:hypothetical protein
MEAAAPRHPLEELCVGDILRTYPGGVYHRVEAIDAANKRVQVLPLYIVDGALYAPDSGGRRSAKWIPSKVVTAAGSGARVARLLAHRTGYEYVPSTTISRRC